MLGDATSLVSGRNIIFYKGIVRSATHMVLTVRTGAPRATDGALASFRVSILDRRRCTTRETDAVNVTDAGSFELCLWRAGPRGMRERADSGVVAKGDLDFSDLEYFFVKGCTDAAPKVVTPDSVVKRGAFIGTGPSYQGCVHREYFLHFLRSFSL